MLRFWVGTAAIDLILKNALCPHIKGNTLGSFYSQSFYSFLSSLIPHCDSSSTKIFAFNQWASFSFFFLFRFLNQWAPFSSFSLADINELNFLDFTIFSVRRWRTELVLWEFYLTHLASLSSFIVLLPWCLFSFVGLSYPSSVVHQMKAITPSLVIRIPTLRVLLRRRRLQIVLRSTFLLRRRRIPTFLLLRRCFFSNDQSSTTAFVFFSFFIFWCFLFRYDVLDFVLFCFYFFS